MHVYLLTEYLTLTESAVVVIEYYQVVVSQKFERCEIWAMFGVCVIRRTINAHGMDLTSTEGPLYPLRKCNDVKNVYF